MSIGPVVEFMCPSMHRLLHFFAAAAASLYFVSFAHAQEGTWDTRADLIEANSEMSVAQIGNTLYVLGGYPSDRVSVDTVQLYDADTDNWTLATAAPQALNHSMAAAVGGVVYLIGGQVSASGSGPFEDSVYEYDPATLLWTEKAAMPTARSGAVTGVIGGKIYVAGGRPPRGNDFAVYDPVANSWQTLPDLPTQRNHFGGGVVDGKFYVVGGRFGAGFSSEITDILEVYDPDTNAWTELAPMPTKRGGHNAIAVHDCIHVFGGEASSGVFEEHEVYDAATDSWQSMNPMPTPIHGVTGLAFIDGWIHLPGGGTSTGGSSGSVIHQVYEPAIDCRPAHSIPALPGWGPLLLAAALLCGATAKLSTSRR